MSDHERRAADVGKLQLSRTICTAGECFMFSLHSTKSICTLLEEIPHALHTNRCAANIDERTHVMARRYTSIAVAVCLTPRAVFVREWRVSTATVRTTLLPCVATSLITSHLPSGVGAFRRQDHTPAAPSVTPAVATPKAGKRLFAARPGWLILQHSLLRVSRCHLPIYEGVPMFLTVRSTI